MAVPARDDEIHGGRRVCHAARRAARRCRAAARALATLATLAAAATGTVRAFEVDGDTWPVPSATFHVSLPAAGGGQIWNDAFETAMSRWSAVTPFQFLIVRDSFADPCSDPNVSPPINGVKFSDTVCGAAWGQTTLAIEQSWFTNGGKTTLQSGIIFNSNESWNVYSGPWQKPGFFGVADFGRVAVHELGHSLGLGHEDAVPAIMATFAGDLEVPQADDVAGAEFLYLDTDGDGVRDSDDADDDNDGVPDAADDFPLDPNESRDTDGDGVGDNADADDDNDGIPDDVEIANGLNPRSPIDAALDADGDGLSNLEEFLIGSGIRTADTDGDGVDDGDEVAGGRDPLRNESAVVPLLLQILGD